MKGVLTLVRPWRPSNMTSDPSGASLRGVAAFVGAVTLQERAAALELALGERPDWDASAIQVEALYFAHEALLGAIAALPQAPEAELQHAA